jgi:hypothetical protein
MSGVCLCSSQDAFGNYVVQYVLELGQSEASQAIITQLNSHFAELSMQKFSSNVVERCLKLGGVVSHRDGPVLVTQPACTLSHSLKVCYQVVGLLANDIHVGLLAVPGR